MERCGRLYSERLRTIGFQTVCEPSGHLPGFWQPSINMGMATIGFYEPCQKMDAIRPGLRKILDGQRGMLAIVLNGGAIKVGDAISVEP